MSKVMVKWRMNGSLARDGMAYSRTANDEDIVDEREARRLIVCGLCEEVGPLDKVEKSRRLRRRR